MHRITQQSGTSCGIACIAMLARISYNRALAVAKDLYEEGTWSEKKSHRTNIEDIRYILDELGWKLGRKMPTTDWEKVPPGCLVAVQLKKGNWHWVVSAEDDDGLFFFDPRKAVKAAKRRDFGRVPVAWYHRLRTAT